VNSSGTAAAAGNQQQAGCTGPSAKPNWHQQAVSERSAKNEGRIGDGVSQLRQTPATDYTEAKNRACAEVVKDVNRLSSGETSYPSHTQVFLASSAQRHPVISMPQSFPAAGPTSREKWQEFSNMAEPLHAASQRMQYHGPGSAGHAGRETVRAVHKSPSHVVNLTFCYELQLRVTEFVFKCSGLNAFHSSLH